MKISIITRHAVSNYGSVLQAFSLQEVLRQLGHEVEIVDYVRVDEEPARLERTMLSIKPSWNCSLPRRILYLALRTPESIIAGLRFKQERVRLLTTTRRYKSEEELRDDPPSGDVHMVGSDQVWGPVGPNQFDAAYVLSYAPNHAPRVSYAASFGKVDLPYDVRRNFANELEKFSAILVREDAAVETLASWGLESTQVLDPTLLLSKDYWDTFSGPIRDSGYILIYQIHNNPMVERFAGRAAERLGLPVLRVSASIRQVVRKGKFRYLPKVDQFISYINNASLVVTDSFHGTAFSINLNTPFVEVLPDNGTSSRNISILRLLGLEDRITRSADDVDIIDRVVDFESVNRRLEAHRRSSLSALCDALTRCMNNDWHDDDFPCWQ